MGRAVSSIAVLLIVLCISVLPCIATASTADNEMTTLEDHQALQSTSAYNKIIIPDNRTNNDPIIPRELLLRVINWQLVSPSGVVISIIDHMEFFADDTFAFISPSGEVIAIIDHTEDLGDHVFAYISPSGEVIATIDTSAYNKIIESDIDFITPSYPIIDPRLIILPRPLDFTFTGKLVSPSGEVIAIIDHMEFLADGTFAFISPSGEVIAIVDHTEYIADHVSAFISPSGNIIAIIDDYQFLALLMDNPVYDDVILAPLDAGHGLFGVMPYPVWPGSDR